MKTQLLLPNKFKLIGWCLLIPATIYGIYVMIAQEDARPFMQARVFALAADTPGSFLVNTNYLGFYKVPLNITIAGVLFIAGGLLVGFSRQKREDEFIASLRLSSLLWAVLANYILLLLAFVFVYGITFFQVMEYNMFTVLIIFIIRFNYLLYKNSGAIQNEK